MRHQPIPWAYRVFYRHIGLDPDVQRTPVEELALERMKQGGFKSQQPARRRADDRDHRVRRRASGPSTPIGSPAGSGSGRASRARARGPPRRAAGRDPRGRRRASARSRCSSARRPRAAGSGRRRKRTLLVAIQVGGRARDRGRGGVVAGRRGASRCRHRPPVGDGPEGAPCPKSLDQQSTQSTRPPPAPGSAESTERLARARPAPPDRRPRARLGELFASAFPRRGIEWQVGAVGGPRVLVDRRPRAGPRRARRAPARRPGASSAARPRSRRPTAA